MKHFRLLACLAIIATFTSVFAAWELENYADSYKDEAVMTATVVQDINTIEALKIEITNDSMPSVTFDAGAADVSGEVNVKVTANIAEEDINKYNYFFMPFVGANVTALTDVETYVPGDAVPSTTAMTALSVGADGTAVISAETLETALVPTLEVSQDSLNTFSADMAESEEALTEAGLSGGIGILVYAEKAE